MFKFLIRWTTLRTLQRSLINLSKSDTTHMECTDLQITSTRLAILKLSGTDLIVTPQQETAYLEFQRMLQRINEAQKTLANFSSEITSNRATLSLMENRLKELNQQIESKEKELADLTEIAIG